MLFWKSKKQKLQDRLSTGEFVMLGDTLDAGVIVSRESMMEIAVVFACMNILTESVGCIPIKVFKNEKGIRKDASWTREGKMLTAGANDFQTAQDWLTQIMFHLLSYGDYYAKILYVDGYIDQLIPFSNPEEFTTEIRNGQKVFYRQIFGQTQATQYTSKEIFHIPAPSPDGYTGRDFIHTHRQTLSLAKSICKYGAKFFSNGGAPRGILVIPGIGKSTVHDKSGDKIAKAKEAFRKSYGGDNWHEIAVFPAETEFKPLSVDPDKSQALETRQQVNKEIAAIYNVPFWRLYQETAPTLEQRNSFYTDSLTPWLTRISGHINKQILPDGFYCKFIPAALLQADLKSRYEAYQIAIGSRFLCPNEVRAMEEKEPYQGGDKFINPNVMSKTDAEQIEKEKSREV